MQENNRGKQNRAFPGVACGCKIQEETVASIQKAPLLPEAYRSEGRGALLNNVLLCDQFHPRFQIRFPNALSVRVLPMSSAIL